MVCLSEMGLVHVVRLNYSDKHGVDDDIGLTTNDTLVVPPYALLAVTVTV
jgi:hypothetical protein